MSELVVRRSCGQGRTHFVRDGLIRPHGLFPSLCGLIAADPNGLGVAVLSTDGGEVDCHTCLRISRQLPDLVLTKPPVWA